MSNLLRLNLTREAMSHISAAMWMMILTSACIYVLGIYLAATISQISWLRPVFSGLTIVTGISSLNLLKVTRVEEALQENEKAILWQKHNEALYAPQLDSRMVERSANLEDRDIYFSPWV